MDAATRAAAIANLRGGGFTSQPTSPRPSDPFGLVGQASAAPSSGQPIQVPGQASMPEPVGPTSSSVGGMSLDTGEPPTVETDRESGLSHPQMGSIEENIDQIHDETVGLVDIAPTRSQAIGAQTSVIGGGVDFNKAGGKANVDRQNVAIDEVADANVDMTEVDKKYREQGNQKLQEYQDTMFGHMEKTGTYDANGQETERYVPGVADERLRAKQVAVMEAEERIKQLNAERTAVMSRVSPYNILSDPSALLTVFVAGLGGVDKGQAMMDRIVKQELDLDQWGRQKTQDDIRMRLELEDQYRQMGLDKQAINDLKASDLYTALSMGLADMEAKATNEKQKSVAQELRARAEGMKAENDAKAVAKGYTGPQVVRKDLGVVLNKTTEPGTDAKGNPLPRYGPGGDYDVTYGGSIIGKTPVPPVQADRGVHKVTAEQAAQVAGVSVDQLPYADKATASKIAAPKQVLQLLHNMYPEKSPEQVNAEYEKLIGMWLNGRKGTQGDIDAFAERIVRASGAKGVARDVMGRRVYDGAAMKQAMTEAEVADKKEAATAVAEFNKTYGDKGRAASAVQKTMGELEGIASKWFGGDRNAERLWLDGLVRNPTTADVTQMIEAARNLYKQGTGKSSTQDQLFRDKLESEMRIQLMTLRNQITGAAFSSKENADMMRQFNGNGSWGSARQAVGGIAQDWQGAVKGTAAGLSSTRAKQIFTRAIETPTIGGAGLDRMPQAKTKFRVPPRQ